VTAGPTPSEAHRRWWLERFTLDEIRALAVVIWPEDGVGETNL
jgi:hypothetical protein